MTKDIYFGGGKTTGKLYSLSPESKKKLEKKYNIKFIGKNDTDKCLGQGIIMLKEENND